MSTDRTSSALSKAARGWDFDRLPTVRVIVPVGGKVKFGYPGADKEPKVRKRKGSRDRGIKGPRDQGTERLTVRGKPVASAVED